MKPGGDQFTRYFGIEHGNLYARAVRSDFVRLSMLSILHSLSAATSSPVQKCITSPDSVLRKVGHGLMLLQTRPLPISRYAWNLAKVPRDPPICTYVSYVDRQKKMRHNFSWTWALWTSHSISDLWMSWWVCGWWRGEGYLIPVIV